MSLYYIQLSLQSYDSNHYDDATDGEYLDYAMTI